MALISLTWGLHPHLWVFRLSSVSTWVVLEERWSSAWPLPYLCLHPEPLDPDLSPPRWAPWLCLSPLRSLWTCLVCSLDLTLTFDLRIGFPAWPRTCLNTVITSLWSGLSAGPGHRLWVSPARLARVQWGWALPCSPAALWRDRRHLS